MSHTISISNDLYMKLTIYAQKSGQPLEEVIETLLANGIQNAVPLIEIGEYDPATDPLAEFIGAFDCGDEPGWLDHHDEIFGGRHAHQQ